MINCMVEEVSKLEANKRTREVVNRMVEVIAYEQAAERWGKVVEWPHPLQREFQGAEVEGEVVEIVKGLVACRQEQCVHVGREMVKRLVEFRGLKF